MASDCCGLLVPSNRAVLCGIMCMQYNKRYTNEYLYMFMLSGARDRLEEEQRIEKENAEREAELLEKKAQLEGSQHVSMLCVIVHVLENVVYHDFVTLSHKLILLYYHQPYSSVDLQVQSNPDKVLASVLYQSEDFIRMRTLSGLTFL